MNAASISESVLALERELMECEIRGVYRPRNVCYPSMAKFIVPENVGECLVFRGLTGKWTVGNNQSGQNAIYLPCKSKEEADRICERLKTGEHNGQINIPSN